MSETWGLDLSCLMPSAYVRDDNMQRNSSVINPNCLPHPVFLSLSASDPEFLVEDVASSPDCPLAQPEFRSFCAPSRFASILTAVERCASEAILKGNHL